MNSASSLPTAPQLFEQIRQAAVKAGLPVGFKMARYRHLILPALAEAIAEREAQLQAQESAPAAADLIRYGGKTFRVATPDEAWTVGPLDPPVLIVSHALERWRPFLATAVAQAPRPGNRLTSFTGQELGAEGWGAPGSRGRVSGTWDRQVTGNMLGVASLQTALYGRVEDVEAYLRGYQDSLIKSAERARAEKQAEEQLAARRVAELGPWAEDAIKALVPVTEQVIGTRTFKRRPNIPDTLIAKGLRKWFKDHGVNASVKVRRYSMASGFDFALRDGKRVGGRTVYPPDQIEKLEAMTDGLVRRIAPASIPHEWEGGKEVVTIESGIMSHNRTGNDFRVRNAYLPSFQRVFAEALKKGAIPLSELGQEALTKMTPVRGATRAAERARDAQRKLGTVYGASLRPVDFATVPKGYVQVEAHPEFKFGVVVYPQPLPEDVARNHHLVRVVSPQEAAQEIIPEFKEYAEAYVEDYTDDPHMFAIGVSQATGRRNLYVEGGTPEDVAALVVGLLKPTPPKRKPGRPKKVQEELIRFSSKNLESELDIQEEVTDPDPLSSDPFAVLIAARRGMAFVIPQGDAEIKRLHEALGELANGYDTDAEMNRDDDRPRWRSVSQALGNVASKLLKARLSVFGYGPTGMIAAADPAAEAVAEDPQLEEVPDSEADVVLVWTPDGGLVAEGDTRTYKEVFKAQRWRWYRRGVFWYVGGTKGKPWTAKVEGRMKAAVQALADAGATVATRVEGSDASEDARIEQAVMQDHARKDRAAQKEERRLDAVSEYLKWSSMPQTPHNHKRAQSARLRAEKLGGVLPGDEAKLAARAPASASSKAGDVGLADSLSQAAQEASGLEDAWHDVELKKQIRAARELQTRLRGGLGGPQERRMAREYIDQLRSRIDRENVPRSALGRFSQTQQDKRKARARAAEGGAYLFWPYGEPAPGFGKALKRAFVDVLADGEVPPPQKMSKAAREARVNYVVDQAELDAILKEQGVEIPLEWGGSHSTMRRNPMPRPPKSWKGYSFVPYLMEKIKAKLGKKDRTTWEEKGGPRLAEGVRRMMFLHYVPEGMLPAPRRGSTYSRQELGQLSRDLESVFPPYVKLMALARHLDQKMGLKPYSESRPEYGTTGDTAMRIFGGGHAGNLQNLESYWFGSTGRLSGWADSIRPDKTMGKFFPSSDWGQRDQKEPTPANVLEVLIKDRKVGWANTARTMVAMTNPILFKKLEKSTDKAMVDAAEKAAEEAGVHYGWKANSLGIRQNEWGQLDGKTAWEKLQTKRAKDAEYQRQSAEFARKRADAAALLWFNVFEPMEEDGINLSLQNLKRRLPQGFTAERQKHYNKDYKIVSSDAIGAGQWYGRDLVKLRERVLKDAKDSPNWEDD